MPAYDVKCANKECEYTKEYICTHSQLETIMESEKCPECGANIERDWRDNKSEFKINGFSYKNGYGKGGKFKC
ncbi:hypothetical protein [uncultured Arcobacter sp.]|uniref:hypothetical protein n=1 Tax=uncultured Arcobacter sp. TaxID=165434 RepID=UPI00262289BD|nr:hypothetical protein [uncultured Arcobacter sp.]